MTHDTQADLDSLVDDLVVAKFEQHGDAPGARLHPVLCAFTGGEHWLTAIQPEQALLYDAARYVAQTGLVDRVGIGFDRGFRDIHDSTRRLDVLAAGIIEPLGDLAEAVHWRILPYTVTDNVITFNFEHPLATAEADGTAVVDNVYHHEPLWIGETSFPRDVTTDRWEPLQSRRARVGSNLDERGFTAMIHAPRPAGSEN